MRHSRAARLMFLGVLVAVTTVFPAMAAMPTTGDNAVVTAQTGPYDPPEFVEVDLPGWAQPFEPLARLPLWAQAALVSAAVAGLVFIVPIGSRWVLSLGEDAEQTARESDE